MRRVGAQERVKPGGTTGLIDPVPAKYLQGQFFYVLSRKLREAGRQAGIERSVTHDA